MRLGNAEDAKTASEQIGTEHRFVLTQLTDTVGSSVTDTGGDSYTSTVGTADSVADSVSASDTTGRSRGRGRSRQDSFAPFGHFTGSASRDSSYSVSVSDSRSLTAGINESTAWGLNTSRAVGGNESLASTAQRCREFLVEQHELQQLPPSAIIVSYAAREGRQVVLADSNPGIMALPTATLASLAEARLAPELAVPVPGWPRSGGRAWSGAGAGPARAGPMRAGPARVLVPGPVRVAAPGPVSARMPMRLRALAVVLLVSAVLVALAVLVVLVAAAAMVGLAVLVVLVAAAAMVGLAVLVVMVAAVAMVVAVMAAWAVKAGAVADRAGFSGRRRAACRGRGRLRGAYPTRSRPRTSALLPSAWTGVPTAAEASRPPAPPGLTRWPSPRPLNLRARMVVDRAIAHLRRCAIARSTDLRPARNVRFARHARRLADLLRAGPADSKWPATRKRVAWGAPD